MDYYCCKCKKSILPDEYEYSKKHFNEPLCRIHQASSGSNHDNGLSTKEREYKEGMIKGRIAETLVEELFLSLGYNVFRYGMENTVPGIMKLLKGVRSDVADTIRRMPDFVIQNTRNNEVFFVEVKFRADENFSFKDDIPKDYPFENAFFIVLSKKHIKCLMYQELKSGKVITPSSHNYLGDRVEFGLDKESIIAFCEFAVKYFENV